MRNGIINIVHNTPGVGQSSFGVGQVVLNLVREQSELGCDSRIWCTSSAEDVRWAYLSSDITAGRIVRYSTIGPSRLAYSPRMIRAANAEGWNIDVVHQHGIWTCGSYVTHLLHRKNCTPCVIAPHGSLESWALKRSRWKKALVFSAYERANLNEATCFHSTSESEIKDIRDFGVTGPIAVIPNGVSSRWLNSQGDAEAFRTSVGVHNDRRILLFMSRITPKKGLPMLIQAISKLKKEFADWILIIIGADEFGHKAEVEHLIRTLKLEGMVRFIGPLFDQTKRDAFAAAELFVLPSYSEGSPLAVLDSLGAEVPVIATKATPWKELQDCSCGLWVETSVSGIAEALNTALCLSRKQLAAMGQRGKMLVSSRYSWVTSARRTLGLYEWILGRHDRPDFIIVD